jgi:hypothetical protein
VDVGGPGEPEGEEARMNRVRVKELAGEVLEAELEAAELHEAKKGKGGKGGSLPGPLIGYLMKKGVISRSFKKKGGGKRKGKAVKAGSYGGKMFRLKRGHRKGAVGRLLGSIKAATERRNREKWA